MYFRYQFMVFLAAAAQFAYDFFAALTKCINALYWQGLFKNPC
jgi:hypothetical protein